MIVPIPYNFEESGFCKDKILIFNGVNWFRWSHGYEYTYFFRSENWWTRSVFYTSNGKECKQFLNIDDNLLIDKPFVKHGYPLKGTGYITGINSIDNKLYAELILTSHYLTHLKVECDNTGHFVDNGSIKYPPTPSCETIEKRKNFLLKKYEYLTS